MPQPEQYKFPLVETPKKPENESFLDIIRALDTNVPREKITYTVMFNALPPQKQTEIQTFFTTPTAIAKAIRGAYNTLFQEEKIGISNHPLPLTLKLRIAPSQKPSKTDYKSRAAGDDTLKH